MKKHITLLILIISLSYHHAQHTTYQAMIKTAEKTIQKDATKNAMAFALYEQAFQKFPDSIQPYQIYKASILASKIQAKTKAFKYLTYLSELEKDEEGYPGWDYVIGSYAKEDYKNLLQDSRFKALEKKAIINKASFFKKLLQKEKEFFTTSKVNFNNKTNRELYQYLTTYHPYLPKKQQNYSISMNIQDSIKSSYFVHLPPNYTPKKQYPILFFLHGAVHFSELVPFQTAEGNLAGWNRFYTKYADKNNVILVFPRANKKYNWMTSDDGFFMIPKILKQLKSTININDNKVFISGHSNGATGSFSYLMKQPTEFAGMYGFNTHPMVYTGGTFIENSKNRSFRNFSTDQDYYYPPNANDTLNTLMENIGADYKDYRYHGFPHWFPQFDASEPAYKILFSDIKKRSRNPFPQHINWEFDDNRYGNIDWLKDVTLDTLQHQKKWQKQINFKIKKWYGYNKKDSLVAKKVNKDAFMFPRKSGKIIAEYNRNTFNIKTSRIKSFSILISPEMVNLKKKIKIYVNGQLYIRKKVNIDRNFMLNNFHKNKDRQQIWVNRVEVHL